MKDILIIAQFTQLPGGKGNNRFYYIAENISKENNVKVEVVTTSFSHKEKSQRNVTKKQLKSGSCKYKILYEPGYPKKRV